MAGNRDNGSGLLRSGRSRVRLPILRRQNLSDMQPLEHELALAGRRLATCAFLPIALLVGFLSMRSYVTDGVTFIVVDALTTTGICLSVGLALVTLFWWGECGHGWTDRFRMIAGCAPLLVLLWRLDPLSLTPTPL